ncbi:MAG: cytochrome b/b6 domain-containing protein [Gammaproteobacteria bacterium]|nr:cytochrome b/b6 domain-containing protein [Gammaproteobacteria bacterium]
MRLSHWAIAFGVLFQITSAWAIKKDYANYEFWYDWHIMVGQLMLIVIFLRIILLFTDGASNWRSFFDYKSQLNAIIQMIKFYLSFARLPLPNWYAHNPLWKPIYLFMIIVLLGCVITGMVYDSNLTLLGYSFTELHDALATIITVLSVAHIITAFLHDWKGKGAFISAIINGHRYFHYPSNNIEGKAETVKTPAIHIAVDSIKNIKNK